MARIRSKSLLIGAFAAIALLVVLAFTPAARADGENFLLVRKVNSGVGGNPTATTMDVVWTGQAADLDSAKLLENGTEVPVSAPAKLKTEMGVVFVIDTGPGMDQGNVLTKVREQIVATAQANPGVRFAIVQAGDKAEVKLDFTTDLERIKSQVDPCAPGAKDCVAPIGPTSSSAIWGGLNLAGSLYEDRDFQPNVVLVTADNNTAGSPTDEPVAKTAITSNGVALWNIGYTGAGLDAGPFEDLAAQTGGRTLLSGEDGQIPLFIDQTMDTLTDQQYLLTFNTTVPAGEPMSLELQVADQSVTVNAISGGGAVEGKALRPELGSRAKTLPFVDNEIALLAAMGLALVAIAGLAYGCTLIFVKDDLTSALSPYADSHELEAQDEDQGNLGNSALIKRAVALTEQVAEQQGLLSRAEASLERANLPLRAGEALFVYLMIVIAATLLPLLLWRNLVPALVFGILGVLTPPAVVNYLAARRRKRFMSQLPDTLSLLSGTLRAGYSLMQGVEAVSQEVDEPMGLELRRVVTESRLGRPLEESLEASADRMDSPDFAWAVMAIRIQREVGGNLAELLLTVADTMIARERLRRDVAALTAEGRVSAVVLGGLPPLLGVVMYVLNPDYTSTLFKEGLGIAMVITAAISMLVGFLWMRKIINIEI